MICTLTSACEVAHTQRIYLAGVLGLYLKEIYYHTNIELVI